MKSGLEAYTKKKISLPLFCLYSNTVHSLLKRLLQFKMFNIASQQIPLFLEPSFAEYIVAMTTLPILSPSAPDPNIETAFYWVRPFSWLAQCRIVDPDEQWLFKVSDGAIYLPYLKMPIGVEPRALWLGSMCTPTELQPPVTHISFCTSS